MSLSLSLSLFQVISRSFTFNNCPLSSHLHQYCMPVYLIVTALVCAYVYVCVCACVRVRVRVCVHIH